MTNPASRPRVAVLGLGLMGAGMARRLAKAGFPLTVYNRNRAKAAPFADEGAQVAASPQEAASQSDIIISMVADDPASRSLWLGEKGALAAAAGGTVLIESSTVSVGWIQELTAAASARNCALIDAPVTGSRPQAAAGELCFLVGGEAVVLEKVRPVLACMSRAIVHLGPTGSGALIKLVNNFLCGVQAVSLAEAMGVIERAGIDRTLALEVLTNGASGSPVIKTLSARMAGRDYTPNFLLRLMAKDLAYAWDEANRRGVDLMMASAALEQFNRAIAAGKGDQDFSAIVEQFRKP